MEGCKDFLQGRCHRGTGCRFVHDQSDPRVAMNPVAPIANDPCKDFLNGRCTRGMECRYAHAGIDPRTGHAIQPTGGSVCLDFLNNRCMRGASCKFPHVADDPSKVAATAGLGAASAFGASGTGFAANPYMQYADPGAAAALAAAQPSYGAGYAYTAAMQAAAPAMDPSTVAALLFQQAYQQAYTAQTGAPGTDYSAWGAAATAVAPRAYVPPLSSSIMTPPTTVAPGMEPCKDFMNGVCDRNPCKFYHPPSGPTAPSECTDWRRGKCHRGATCKFQHTGTPDTNQVQDSMQPCYDFESGRCTRGAGCRYLHAVAAPGAAAATTASFSATGTYEQAPGVSDRDRSPSRDNQQRARSRSPV